MSAFDLRSFVAMGSVMSLLMAGVLLLMRVHYPKQIRGLTHWASAPVLWLVSSVLYAARGHLPPLLSVLTANMMLMLGALLFYAGCRRFLGFAMHWRFWLAYLGGTAGVVAWLAFVQPTYGVRLVVFTVLMMGVYGATLNFLLRHAGHRLPARLLQTLLAWHLLVLLARCVSAIVGPPGSDLLDASPMQSFYIGSYVLTVLMLSVGAVLMANDRLVTELEHLATHDPLTQTLNRRALMRHCEDELARSQRSGHPLVLMMLDLDHFKQINDKHGHQHGDAVLVHFAQTTQAQLRRADRLGRWGGEEFLLLLPETSLDDAQGVAMRIHTALARGHALDCQLSIGLSAWHGVDDRLEAMLARADTALYQAKAQGRNQTCTA